MELDKQTAMFQVFQAMPDAVQRLLSIGQDVDAGVTDMLSAAQSMVNAGACDIVVFLSDAEERIYSTRAQVPEGLASFVRRVTNGLHTTTEGDVLRAYADTGESSRLRLQQAMLSPLVWQGKLYGALLCVDLASPLTQQQRNAVDGLCVLTAIALGNADFYRLHIGQENNLISILENLDTNIYVSKVDTDEILYINRKMRQEFDLPDDYKGLVCWQVLQNGMTECCSFCPNRTLVQDPSQVVMWEEHNTATGKHYRNTDCLIQWLDGTLVHLQNSIDLTQERENEATLVEARIAAEQASNAKSDFLSRMSHEIRTPINAIIGMSRIGAGASDLTKAKECIQIIDSSSVQLLGIINDILDMSKIEANKMVLVKERFNLEEVLINLSNVISVKAEEKQLRLYIHMNLGMPVMYLGDELRISQVLMNLLSNAVKFTPEQGTVHVRMQEIKHEGMISTIEVQVSDNGIGMTKEYQKNLFTSFEQADGGIARKYGGTGLGLAISKRIVEMMGGDISAASEEGAGSTFTFHIKLECLEADSNRRKPREGVDISGLRVMIVEESEENCRYFLQIMDSFKVHADAAGTCAEALTLLERSVAEEKPYNIVFVDAQLPDAHGFEATRRIKQQYGSSVVVMISVSQINADDGEARQAGVSRFITKPLFPSILLDTIYQMIGLAPVEQAQQKNDIYMFAGCSILLVEDVEINRTILMQALEDTKVKFYTAENGQIAVDMFRAHPELYDIILMDVHMPVMDGYEATRSIRATDNARAVTVPILAMTANAFAEDIQKSLDSGMNGHLTKPIDMDKILPMLQKYFIVSGMRQPEQSVEMMEKQGTAVDVTRQSSDKRVGDDHMADEKTLINVEEGLKRVRDNTKIFKVLLTSFESKSYVPQLQTEIDALDWPAAAKTAHAIKGVAANLSLTALYEITVTLESQLKSDYCLDETLEEFLSVNERTCVHVRELIAGM